VFGLFLGLLASFLHPFVFNIYFYANKELMQDIEDVANGECIYMGNITTIKVLDRGKTLLKFTSSRLLSLINVLFVSSLRRNLVSSILLNKVELKTVVKDDKLVIFHKEVFLGKGYLNGSLFVLNLASEILNGNISSSTYIAEFVDLWHGRLGHVNYASIKQLKHMKLISAVDVDHFSKCYVCVEAKHTKTI